MGTKRQRYVYHLFDFLQLCEISFLDYSTTNKPYPLHYISNEVPTLWHQNSYGYEFIFHANFILFSLYRVDRG